MRRSKGLWASAAWFAIASACVSQPLFAAPPSNSPPLVTDIVLRDGGVLLGQVIQPGGGPAAHLPISLIRDGKQLAPATTNIAGYFAFSGLKMGAYQVVAPAAIGTCRVWNAEAAPPGAQPGLLIINGQDAVRGQYDARTYSGMIGKPLVLGGLVAAAIAVPVALTNSKRTPASSH